MLKHFYLFAWILLALSVIDSVYTGTIDPIKIIIYSLLAFTLFWGLGMWLAFFNSKNTEEAK